MLRNPVETSPVTHCDACEGASNIIITISIIIIIITITITITIIIIIIMSHITRLARLSIGDILKPLPCNVGD